MKSQGLVSVLHAWLWVTRESIGRGGAFLPTDASKPERCLLPVSSGVASYARVQARQASCDAPAPGQIVERQTFRYKTTQPHPGPSPVPHPSNTIAMLQSLVLVSALALTASAQSFPGLGTIPASCKSQCAEVSSFANSCASMDETCLEKVCAVSIYGIVWGRVCTDLCAERGQVQVLP